MNFIPQQLATKSPIQEQILARLLAQNNDRPSLSPKEGFVKGLDTFAEALIAKRLDKQNEQKQANTAKVFGDALGAYNRGLAGGTTTTPGGETITWNKNSPEVANQMLINQLTGNVNTAPYAMQLQLGDIERQKGIQGDIEKARALQPLEIEKARELFKVNSQTTPYQSQQLSLEQQQLELERQKSGRGPIPENYELVDGKMVKIEGAPATSAVKPTVESERARKLAEESIDNLALAKQTLFKDGKINRAALLESVDAPFLGTVAVGEGRDLTQAIERSIQNSVYLKTGTAAPEGEMRRLLKQYAPSKYDSDEQIKNKINSLEKFLKSNAPDYETSVPDTAKKDSLPAGWTVEVVQ